LAQRQVRRASRAFHISASLEWAFSGPPSPSLPVSWRRLPRASSLRIVIFEFLVWIPNLSAGPSNHFNWAGNAICIALAGASWLVSDSISAAAKTKPIPAESREEASIPYNVPV